MIPKGKKVSLQHTHTGRERIVVAISWNEAKAVKVSVMDKLRGNIPQQHDLDLSCFVFDNKGAYIDFVGPMAQDNLDHTGAIYHSGDDETGAGDGDDESISCELAGLPDETHHLFFLTEIRSDHTFGQVGETTMRLADGMTNKNLYELSMAVKDGKNARACVMLHIYREPQSATGWALHVVDDYPDITKVSSWGTYLTKYLK